MTRLPIAITLFAGLLIGCGGGGGGSSGVVGGGGNGTSSFSGVAVDGYLHNARAFLDLNNNGIYDAGEPTAMTNSSGSFTLDATQTQIDTYPVFVVAIAGTTVDQDSPNAPMTSGMTLMSPPGNHSVVSPLTTQVVAKMATGLSLADAKTAVQTDLGLTGIDLMKDFVAEKTSNPAYAEAHRIAVSVADVLKTVESESTSSTSLTDRLANARTKVTSDVIPQVALIKQATSNNDALAVLRSITWSSTGNIASLNNCTAAITPIQLVVNAINKSEITFSIHSGALPSGLSLSSDGKIFGTPAATQSDQVSTFKVAATRQNSTPVISDDLTINVDVAGVFYNAVNGHYYKHVGALGAGLSWQDAKNLAETTSCKGMQGYLVTMTTNQELTFIDNVVYGGGKPDNVFMGGSDSMSHGTWRWVTGPEGLMNSGLGAIFYTSGNVANGYVAPWLSLTDMNRQGYDYLFFYSSREAKFNTWNGSLGNPGQGGAGGYLIEYGN